SWRADPTPVRSHDRLASTHRAPPDDVWRPACPALPQRPITRRHGTPERPTNSDIGGSVLAHGHRQITYKSLIFEGIGLALGGLRRPHVNARRHLAGRRGRPTANAS